MNQTNHFLHLLAGGGPRDRAAPDAAFSSAHELCLEVFVNEQFRYSSSFALPTLRYIHHCTATHALSCLLLALLAATELMCIHPFGHEMHACTRLALLLAAAVRVCYMRPQHPWLLSTVQTPCLVVWRLLCVCLCRLAAVYTWLPFQLKGP